MSAARRCGMARGEVHWRLAACSYDISARRQAERRWGAEERLRLMKENTHDYAIFSCDLDRRITSWNSGAERIFGYASDEAIGKVADLIFTEEDRAAGAPPEGEPGALTEGRAADERWHLRKNGSASGAAAP